MHIVAESSIPPFRGSSRRLQRITFPNLTQASAGGAQQRSTCGTHTYSNPKDQALRTGASPQGCRRRGIAVTAAAMSSIGNGFSPLVTTSWLKDRLADPSVSVLDTSWYMPNAGRNPAQEFAQERIPGSRFFDVDKISDTSSSLPHMLPSATAFAAAADALSVSNSSTVILYDRAGIFSAPRVWWTFKAFGHGSVAVLDGGYPAWLAAGLDVDKAPQSEEQIGAGARAAQNPPASTSYRARLQPSLVRELGQVLENVDSGAEVVVDARGPARFCGTAPEPRKGVRGGHIPGSVNVPFDTLLQDGRYKDITQLKQAFSQAGVDWRRPIVTSCGTGVTASVLALALHLIDPQHPTSVYDGSWTEWGGRPDTPVETEP